MIATVKDVLDAVCAIAPPELAEDYDNVGLLVGHPERPVQTAIVALDVTPALVDEALEKGAQLIVSHHPLLFRGRKHLREDDPEGALLCRLVRGRLSLIAAHTNFDRASPGVADALAAALSLQNVRILPQGLRIGELARPMSAARLREYVQKRLGGWPRLSAPDGGATPIRRVAVCGGSGGSLWRVAAEGGANAYVTGEVSYHEGLDAAAAGMAAVDAGHRETEMPGVRALADGLQIRLNALQYQVAIVTGASAAAGAMI
ncbi:MAG: Nif3-like dinuclear metal center hexameric protein [Clostridiales bacterium]|nr:Nif3-like dinuclear metal center hexameric protein [Clostridiales bacterium]